MRLTRLRAVTGAVVAITLAAGVSASAHTSAPPALKNGGTLTIALDADPDALDPTLARTFVGRMVFLDMCEKLYDLNAKLQIVPQLAASLPTFSADKKTVTIKLRTGIKFNDGTPFNAAAVKKSLDRHKTLKGSARASELAPVTRSTRRATHRRPAPHGPLLADHGAAGRPRGDDHVAEAARRARRQVRDEPRLRRAVPVQGSRRRRPHHARRSRRTTTTRRTCTSTRSSGRSSPTRSARRRTCGRTTSITSRRASPSTDLQSIASDCR